MERVTTEINFINVMRQIFIAAAVFVLIAVSCNSQSTTEPTTPKEEVSAATQLNQESFPLAYIDADLILIESQIYKVEMQPLQRRGEAAQRDWSIKEQQFQAEIVNLNERYSNGLITTANAQAEQQRIEQRVEAYQLAAQRQAQELEEENNVLSNRTQLLMREAVQSVNKDGRYKMIFNATSLVDADTLLNISTQVREELDRLYAVEKSNI